jgi:hypothetical protein
MRERAGQKNCNTNWKMFAFLNHWRHFNRTVLVPTLRVYKHFRKRGDQRVFQIYAQHSCNTFDCSFENWKTVKLSKTMFPIMYHLYCHLLQEYYKNVIF